MPIVEKVKKPVSAQDTSQVAEDISIEKPRTRKPPTEAMKEAGRKNLEKGRLALQEKRKSAVKEEKPPTSLKVAIPSIQETSPIQPPSVPRPRSRKVIYQEESDSEDEVIIVKKKKKPTKKIIYQEDSEDEQPIIKKKSIPAVERTPSPPRYVQPTAVIRWI